MVPEPSSAYSTLKKGIKLCFVTMMGNDLIMNTYSLPMAIVFVSI